MAKVVSFGYDYGGPPEGADHVEDVRNVAYKPSAWKAHAKAIVGRSKGKKVIAVGDKHGHTRAPKIAAHVAHTLGGPVSHRDQHKPRLLKGQSGENTRALKHAGMTEADATKVAVRHG